jgi:hypothetical protein
VSAGADLVVEGAVDLVSFGSEDGGEVVGHGESGSLGGARVTVNVAGHYGYQV